MTAKSQIVVIKTLQHKLNMDDATYRDGLEGLTGKRSSTELTDAQLGRVLHWLRELDQQMSGGSDGQIGLIRHLWGAMYRCGVIRDGRAPALDAYCRRMVRVPLNRCSPAQCQCLIECLKKWYRRSTLPEHIDLLDRMTVSEDTYVQ